MQIKIPLRVIRWADAFADWLNVPLWGIRRVYIIVAMLGAAQAVWWYDAYGWWGALEAALMLVLVVMCALWFF
jgi:hypothetical protein